MGLFFTFQLFSIGYLLFVKGLQRQIGRGNVEELAGNKRSVVKFTCLGQTRVTSHRQRPQIQWAQVFHLKKFHRM